MRARTLTFADAVRLLGGDSPIVAALGRLAGAGAAAATVKTLSAVDFFALRDEAVRWGNTVVNAVRERASGIGRFDRTQRLVAAHAVIVVVAYYEALELYVAEHGGLDLRSAELTAAEQVSLAGGGPPGRDFAELVQALLDTGAPIPSPHQPFEATLDALDWHYRAVTDALRTFLLGLQAFGDGRSGLGALLDVNFSLPQLAVQRYVEAYRALAVQVPEFQVWAAMVDGQATRAAFAAEVADLRARIDDLRAGRPGPDAVDAVRTGLGRRHWAQLEKSILSSADAPAHIVMPSLRRGYVPPRGRVATAGPNDLPATETWWQGRAEIDDVQDFLVAHLTGPGAVDGPLVVLGQPGSGKSVLTRMLAGTLPGHDFLVVRVELRAVRADAPIQAQLEGALQDQLGEQVSWPDVVRRAGSALPVIIMDGFDELLQATGINRADYLEQLAEFQQREAELGRPLAALLTSRLVVADRARFPEGTVVLRLEPFHPEQVREWLQVWNSLNAASLRQRDLHPLPVEVALAQGELAGQPLLLLLLALYDAGANDLQKTTGEIGRVELYERLFNDFVAREVDKDGTECSVEQRAALMQAEWRRLCAVALAMLNRGADVISAAQLDRDLPHLLHPGDLTSAPTGSLSRALTVGELLVGRFFFIHESQASRDTGAPERSFEFLHATFGEFLAARQLVAALVDLADERLHQLSRPHATLDAGPLYAATSFVTVARRAPLWEFCRGLLARLDPDRRRHCRDLVLDLLPEAGYPHPTWSLAGYEPRRKPVAARHAAFSANLVCFAVLLSDGPVDAVELTGEPVVVAWRRQALLWQSQLDLEDSKRLWQMLRVSWRLDTHPTRLEVRPEDGTDVGVYESLPWPPDRRPPTIDLADPGMLVPEVRVPAQGSLGYALRRSALVQTAHEVREHLYALMPYWRRMEAPDLIHGGPGQLPVSDAAVLFELLLSPAAERTPGVRGDLFAFALRVANSHRHRHLVLRQLADDVGAFTIRQLLPILGAMAPATVVGNLADLATVLVAVAQKWEDGPQMANAIAAYLLRDVEKFAPAHVDDLRTVFASAFTAAGVHVEEDWDRGGSPWIFTEPSPHLPIYADPAARIDE